MVLIDELQTILRDAEQLQVDAEAAATRSAELVAELLALDPPADGWTHEHRARLLQQTEAHKVPPEGAPKVAVLMVNHNVAEEARGAVSRSRENLLAEVGRVAITRLQELAAQRPLAELEAIAEARRSDLTPGSLSWVWFPGRGLFRWIRRRWRSHQFARAALVLRDQLDDLDDLLDVFRLLSPWITVPEHVQRPLDAAEQYLVAHRQLLEKLTHGA